MTHYTTRRDTAVAATLAAIDEAVTRHCETCETPLPDGCPSDWWCSEACQTTWQGTYGRLPGIDTTHTHCGHVGCCMCRGAPTCQAVMPPGSRSPSLHDYLTATRRDPGADLTPWQRDVLRAAYTPGPDGLPRYRRMYVVPSRRHGLVTLFRKLTGRTQ